MRILPKLITALRGAATETGEAIVDSQQLRILDQEMRDADEDLNGARENLTQVMAERRGVERKIEELGAQISEYTGYVESALNKGNEDLATSACEKIAELEEELGVQRDALGQMDTGLTQMRHSIKETERNITAMRRQVNLIKATEKVQNANESAAKRFAGTSSSVSSASQSLERIRTRQQGRADRMEAASQLQEETEGTDLKRRLAAAGITKSASSGNDVLARIRAKQNANK